MGPINVSLLWLPEWLTKWPPPQKWIIINVLFNSECFSCNSTLTSPNPRSHNISHLQPNSVHRVQCLVHGQVLRGWRRLIVISLNGYLFSCLQRWRLINIMAQLQRTGHSMLMMLLWSMMDCINLSEPLLYTEWLVPGVHNLPHHQSTITRDGTRYR